MIVIALAIALVSPARNRFSSEASMGCTVMPSGDDQRVSEAEFAAEATHDLHA
jgi:hypothetical protein